MNKWDYRFYSLAENIATWSKDPDCQVGAMLVSTDKREFAPGFNGFAMGLPDSAELLLCKESKNKIMVHAELNSILNARRNLTGWSIYITRTPCISCANAIIQAGIVDVICPPPIPNSSWLVENTDALDLLNRAQIIVRFITGQE